MRKDSSSPDCSMEPKRLELEKGGQEELRLTEDAQEGAASVIIIMLPLRK